MRRQRVFIVVKRDIKAGEEFGYDYGKEYWEEYIKPPVAGAAVVALVRKMEIAEKVPPSAPHKRSYLFVQQHLTLKRQKH